MMSNVSFSAKELRILHVKIWITRLSSQNRVIVKCHNCVTVVSIWDRDHETCK